MKSAKQALAAKEQDNATLRRDLKELADKVQHLSSSNQSLKREATEAKTASSDLQSEHQKSIRSLTKKCASYEKEIGEQLSMECV